MSYRWWLITAISLFIVGIWFGVITYNNAPVSFSTQAADLQNLSELIVSLPRPLMMAVIFFKNTLAVAASIVLSPVFLLVPVMTLLVNGWLIGLVSGAVIHQQSVAYLLVGLLPHGIFELPALFMGEAVAFSIGATVIKAVFKNQTAGLKAGIKRDMRFMIPIVVLFVVAAAIETYVTPAVLQLVT
jgi:stage II sporulation protein M